MRFIDDSPVCFDGTKMGDAPSEVQRPFVRADAKIRAEETQAARVSDTSATLRRASMKQRGQPADAVARR
jgi:hypothetical protein